MKIKLLCIIICLFWAVTALAVPTSESPAGKVTWCFDGDTMKLRDRRIVRLAGIDSPEMPRNGKNAQVYARNARKILSDLVAGQEIKLNFPGVSTQDKYGRLIAEVILPDGQSLNENLVDQGAAWFYPHQDLSPDFQERLRELQADAIHERRGMWDKILALPFANAPYIGNRASLRFFPMDCPAAQNIKPRNRVNFGNLMDAFLAGYAPARICEFWPDE